MKPLISNLSGISIENIMFFDIETVTVEKTLPKKGSPLYESWAYKRRKEDETTSAQLKASFAEKGALYAEFAKVAAISIGMLKSDGVVYIQTYYGKDEVDILTKFTKALNALYSHNANLILCGHSVIGFDIPFLVRRMLVNRIAVPEKFNPIGKKPWILAEEVLDVGEWWKSTGFYGASLINMAVCLGIPSPKQSLDGSKVSETYYKGELDAVAKYCELDVFTLVNIVEHFYGLDHSEGFVSKTFPAEQLKLDTDVKK